MLQVRCHYQLELQFPYPRIRGRPSRHRCRYRTRRCRPSSRCSCWLMVRSKSAPGQEGAGRWRGQQDVLAGDVASHDRQIDGTGDILFAQGNDGDIAAGHDGRSKRGVLRAFGLADLLEPTLIWICALAASVCAVVASALFAASIVRFACTAWYAACPTLTAARRPLLASPAY